MVREFLHFLLTVLVWNYSTIVNPMSRCSKLSGTISKISGTNCATPISICFNTCPTLPNYRLINGCFNYSCLLHYVLVYISDYTLLTPISEMCRRGCPYLSFLARLVDNGGHFSLLHYFREIMQEQC
jgi:hypothetical protein